MQLNTNCEDPAIDSYNPSVKLRISFRARTVSPLISRGATKRTEVMLLLGLFTIN